MGTPQSKSVMEGQTTPCWNASWIYGPSTAKYLSQWTSDYTQKDNLELQRLLWGFFNILKLVYLHAQLENLRNVKQAEREAFFN